MQLIIAAHACLLTLAEAAHHGRSGRLNVETLGGPSAESLCQFVELGVVVHSKCSFSLRTA